VRDCGTCADTLDGRLISDVERQFLKNWKAMRHPELRLMAPPVDSSCTANSPQLSAGTAKVSMSSAGTRQQSGVSARQSVSEPSSADMSVVPCSAVSTKQPLYYDSQLHVFSVVNLLFVSNLTTVTYFGPRSFTVAGPKAWNQLPADIRAIDSVNSFKSVLKTFLFR